MLDFIRDYFSEKDELPNKFTLFMGERIRTAREEAGFSQEKLAKLLYLRRATLSNIENGKSEASAQTYVHAAYTLNKPLAYFLPDYFYREIKQEDLSPAENELVTNYRYHIASDYFGKLIIDFIKMLGEFDTNSFVIEQAPYVKDFLKSQKDFQKFLEKRKKIDVEK